jgi:VCPO second helical-bundle domain
MPRISRILAISSIGVAFVAVAADAALANPQHGRRSGEVIRAWNEIARSQAFGNPIRFSRVLAIMHAAQHDAVNGAEPRYETYASLLSDPSADAEAAAAAAAHTVLLFFFPASQGSLDTELAESLASVPDGPGESAGVALGQAVGRLLLDSRANDGFDVPEAFAPTPGPGVWEPTPPAFAPMLEAQFQNVSPFTLRDRSQFFPDPPPDLASTNYARDFNEVKRLGQDTSPFRTADQTQLAHFWAEGSPVGWSRVGSIVSSRRDYDLHQTARLLALLNMAMADGFIAGWYQKRLFAFWRPVTAIRKAETDGNPDTSPDPTWLPLRPTPALPDYPSTHSLLGGAAAEILRRLTGDDRFRFCMTSTTSVPASTERCWKSFTEAELENASSRVVVGFHFRFATATGVEVGRKVGKFAIRHSLRPLHISARSFSSARPASTPRR